ncbi:CapA family protein [Pseudonocardia sp. H11422]|uniref:CapA family protein n=1 Tax=Pseudonocardia sp. H11422 TaxID=2835866 RepID=UPI001BDD3722|nr:CapA family protein [Pseudonocardia sp. H11422]
MPRRRSAARASHTLLAALAMVLAGCSPADGPASAGSGPGTTTAPPTSFRVIATGDVLIHQGGSLVRGAADAGRANGNGYDFTGVLAQVAPVIQDADLAVCHLETPVAETTGPFRGYPSFNVQPQILDALAGAGYDTCSTASNHSLDAGFTGLVRTLDALDARGIGHAGTFRTAEESRAPGIAEVRDARVAHLSWTYGLNGIPLPSGREWSVNVFDPVGPDIAGVLGDAARARRAGAQVVIVSVHCCTEYVHDPTDTQVTIARALLASPDIDLVLGHHAHVVQPFEKINGKWVAYGLGNHIAQQSRAGSGETEDSMIARFTFTRAADGRYSVTKAEAVPTRIDIGRTTTTIVLTGTGGAGVDGTSYNRVVEILGRRRAPTDGLIISAK